MGLIILVSATTYPKMIKNIKGTDALRIEFRTLIFHSQLVKNTVWYNIGILAFVRFLAKTRPSYKSRFTNNSPTSDILDKNNNESPSCLTKIKRLSPTNKLHPLYSAYSALTISNTA